MTAAEQENAIGASPTAQQPDGAGFETTLETTELQVGGIAAYAREQHELQAAFTMAVARPRNEMRAFASVLKSCERPTFAERAMYSYPRGGAKIEGPSVNLAREMARLWGNLRYGIRIVSMDMEYVQVQGWVLDLETNTHNSSESKFRKLVFRKGKGWVEPDERDLRELVNKHGAICVRNALLQVMPSDLIEEAMARSRATLQAEANGSLKRNPRETVIAIVKSFDGFGVSVDQLEDYLGHKLEAITAEEVADLRAVLTSLKDGNTKASEHFGKPGTGDAPPTTGNERLKKKLEPQQE